MKQTTGRNRLYASLVDFSHKAIVPSKDGRRIGATKHSYGGLYYSHAKRKWVKSDGSYRQSNVWNVVKRFWNSHPLHKILSGEK